MAGTKKVGHLGTAPSDYLTLATGVLLLLVIGRATRLAQFYTRRDKVYEATIRFGFATDTYDRAGVATSPPCALPLLDEEMLEQTYLQPFRWQVSANAARRFRPKKLRASRRSELRRCKHYRGGTGKPR